MTRNNKNAAKTKTKKSKGRVVEDTSSNETSSNCSEKAADHTSADSDQESETEEVKAKSAGKSPSKKSPAKNGAKSKTTESSHLFSDISDSDSEGGQPTRLRTRANASKGASPSKAKGKKIALRVNDDTESDDAKLAKAGVKTTRTTASTARKSIGGEEKRKSNDTAANVSPKSVASARHAEEEPAAKSKSKLEVDDGHSSSTRTSPARKPTTPNKEQPAAD